MSTFTFAPATKKARARGHSPRWVYEDRLTRRVEVDDNDCWVWTGPLMPNGYGQSNAFGKVWLNHRLAYELWVGPIPSGYQVDHLCRNRACINPNHLDAVTQAENLRRQGAAVTHCPRLHPYDEQNTYRTAIGGRVCKTCARERQRVAA